MAILASPMPNPCGVFVLDASHADPKTRDAAVAYFRGRLNIASNGSFDLASINMSGYWRVERGRLVLVYSHFFDLPRMQPDEEIKASWPSSQVEGHVMTVLRDGRLRLADFGRCKGPFFFCRARREPTATLVPKSMRDGGDSSEAFCVLRNEADGRCAELVEYIQDARNPTDARVWAAGFFKYDLSKRHRRDVLEVVSKLNTKGLPDKVVKWIRSRLLRQVGDYGEPELAARLVALGDRYSVPPRYLAGAIAAARYAPAVPRLEQWLQSPMVADREAACKALALLRVETALPQVRRLVQDPDRRMRIAANGAILRLSADSAERADCIKRLISDESPEDYMNTSVIEVLEASAREEAVPPLIDFLTHGKDEFDRRKAAEALGVLGFAVALPVLRDVVEPKAQKIDQSLSAEQREQVLEDALSHMGDDRWVRKNAIEAIWRINHLGARTPSHGA